LTSFITVHWSVDEAPLFAPRILIDDRPPVESIQPARCITGDNRALHRPARSSRIEIP